VDTRVEGLVAEARSGSLTRRQVVERAAALGVSAATVLALIDGPSVAEASGRGVRPEKWQKGKGWGWVWGPDDEVGALNELSPALARKALARARGRVYDLGLEYDRRSFKFPGHASGEITTYRSPQGLLLQRDQPAVIDPSSNSTRTTWASCLNTISDNVATQIDGLGHIYEGDPSHAYNGFKASEVVGDHGLVKLDVTTIPPVVAPATLIDVAGHLGREALPGHYAIGPDLLRAVLRRQRVDIDPLDVVLIRTGTAGVWLRGDGVGANTEEVEAVDSAGITVSAARWLVEEKGALMIGSDTSALEVTPPTEQLPDGTSFNPVHVYLLVRQGVHILELNNLEDLARDGVYKLAYVLSPNKIRGNVAGTVQRPVGLA
jgi:kynurenine formamidase